MSIDLEAADRWRAVLAQSPTLIHRGDCYGLERESLRALADGRLAQSCHPRALGSSLTSKFITTDFSESQVEFTTSPYRTIGGVLRELRHLQIFALEALQSLKSFEDSSGEGMWPLSMPPALPESEDDIPIACYGDSDLGRMKHIYRQGLGRRYGRRMQTVSGVHFNFSFSRRFFRALLDALPGDFQEQELQNELYFSMIRNFQRESVFLMYLFGASPAVDASFLSHPDDRLSAMDFDPRTLYAPHATSLRLSDIGYTNSNQCELAISYDSLDDYIQTMCRAVSSRNPAYSQWNFERGEQLNDFQLQIENEHYGVIRPKQTPQGDERPLSALKARGVRYLEVRCLDVDPYDPGGVSEERMAFVHLVLLKNLLSESPALSREDCSLQRDNQKQVAWRGRDPALRLQLAGSGAGPENFRDAGRRWLEGLTALAERLDREIDCDERYQKSLNVQRAKFEDAECTPSARMLQDMRAERLGHIDFGLRLLERHRGELQAAALPLPMRRKLETAARESFVRHAEIESAAKSAPGGAAVELPAVCSGS